MNTLADILDKNDFTRDELIYLLSLQGSDMEQLLNKADRIRQEFVGDDVYLRGVIEFSNICEQNCIYCGLRKSNSNLNRYRMDSDQIIETASRIIKSGIKTIVLQSGEDHYYDSDMISYIIYSIKKLSDVAITLCLGEREFEEYKSWKYAGADRYLLKHETANPKIYSSLHHGQKLEDRLKHLEYLRKIGYQVGTGNMVGLPNQQMEDIADDILLCKKIDVDMAAFGPFVASPHTPLAYNSDGSVNLTLKTLAIARIVLKNAHIPATTALASIDDFGREKGLSAGANVVMPNFTPSPFRENYVIYPDKKCLYDDPNRCSGCLGVLIGSLGRTVGVGKGDSFKMCEQI